MGRAMKVTIRGGIRRSFFFHPLVWQYCGLKKRLVIMISFFQYPPYTECFCTYTTEGEKAVLWQSTFLLASYD